MDYDTLLSLAGDAGFFQVTLFLLMGFVNSYTNLENMAVNFLSPLHNHWCNIPVPLDANISHEQVRQAAFPAGDESCSMYDVTWVSGNSNQSMLQVNTSITHSCLDGYEFDQSEHGVTATSQFELVCDKAWQLDFVSPVYAAGFLIGAFTAGTCSDRYGRKLAMLLYVGLHIVAGVATTFSVNVWMYIVCRMLVAVSVRATGTTAAVLLMECLANRHRVRAIIGYQMSFSVGGTVLVILAFGIRHFRLLQLVISLSLLPIIAYKWLLPESPRWLLMKGRLQESANAFRRIASRNGRELPDGVIDQYIAHNKAKAIIQTNTAVAQPRFKDLLCNPRLRTYLFVTMFMMSGANVIFFGVGMNIDHLFGDVYINVLLSVLMEIPAVLLLWYIMECHGRKPAYFVMSAAVFVCSAASVTMKLVGGLDLGVTIASIVARGCSSSIICNTLCYTTELFPTSIRSMTLGSVAAMAGAFSVVAPFVGGPMKLLWSPLPDVVYAAISLTACGLSLLLPETLGMSLPETIDDVYRIGNKKEQSSSTCNGSPGETPDKVAMAAETFEEISQKNTDNEKRTMELCYNSDKAVSAEIYELQVPDTYAYYGPESFSIRL